MLWKKINDHTVNTTPNHLPSKMDVLPKTVVQIILAAKKSYSAAFKYVPQPTATTFSISSVCLSVFFYDYEVYLNFLSKRSWDAAWTLCNVVQKLTSGQNSTVNIIKRNISLLEHLKDSPELYLYNVESYSSPCNLK